jgi:hypothetical protein
MLSSISYPIPWYELWLPINPGTIPGHTIAFLWVISLFIFIGRPTLREHLRRVVWFLLLGHIAAILWSASYGLMGLGRWALSDAPTNGAGFADVSSDPQPWFYVILRTGLQTAGLLGEFALIWIASAAVLLIRPRTRIAEQASDGDAYQRPC